MYNDKIQNIDIEEITDTLYYMAIDRDFSDYAETQEKEKADILAALENIKAIAENPLNSDYWRTFLICLDTISYNH